MEQLPWMEKYRPRRLDDIISQPKVIEVFQNYLKNRNPPHLLLYGPPGTGKTSTAYAFCVEWFGTNYNRYVLELNASDDRGIATVRDKIKTFASMSPSKNNMNIIILDEADAMTADAQTALRRIMEIYSTETRFFLICNNISQIIPPLLSRCICLQFSNISFDESIQRLEAIAHKESMKLTSQVAKTLITTYNGDLRKAINSLQLLGSLSEEKCGVTIIDEHFLPLVTNTLHIPEFDGLWDSIISRDHKEVLNNIESLVGTGISLNTILKLFKARVENQSWHELTKAKIYVQLASVAAKVGISSAPIQLRYISLYICDILLLAPDTLLQVNLAVEYI